MEFSRLTEEVIKEWEKKNIWLDLVFVIEEEFDTLEEMLNNDIRIKNFYFDDCAIIHSNDISSFLKESLYKPFQIQPLGEANIGSELLSESAIDDILTNQELVSELLESEFLTYDEINELISILVEKCREIINNLPEDKINNFSINYPDDLMEEEAEKILLPFYLDYREKIREEFIRTDNILTEKINKIQNEL